METNDAVGEPARFAFAVGCGRRSLDTTSIGDSDDWGIIVDQEKMALCGDAVDRNASRDRIKKDFCVEARPERGLHERSHKKRKGSRVDSRIAAFPRSSNIQHLRPNRFEPFANVVFEQPLHGPAEHRFVEF